MLCVCIVNVSPAKVVVVRINCLYLENVVSLDEKMHKEKRFSSRNFIAISIKVNTNKSSK